MRQFDEAALAAVVGDEDIGPAFARLCRMSVVRPMEHGLVLHDDVRRAIADDLRWRRSDRYDGMKLRAVAYYKERLNSATPTEREWLLAELLFLWEDALTHALVYNDPEPGMVWIDAARQEDYSDITRIWNWWRPNVLDRAVGFEGELRGDSEFLEAMIRYPGCRVRVARDRDGTVCGFSTAIPVCQQSIPILRIHSAFSPMIDTYWSGEELAALPVSYEQSRTWFFVHLGYSETAVPEATQAALMRDHVGMYAQGDVYIIVAPHPDIKMLMQAWGYERVPGAKNWNWGPHQAVEGFVLDLRSIGVERWIESILSG
ncbi:MAG TPA: hypothetical protein VHS06_01090, partial [Chloroflexota bacterium]|nr:hypothetical protein [Chloroflexota bacterium]